MKKILKKYTTIPMHLYVNRNADIQLERIIVDMQRPGYVLVARQMGKTNLLFNAKRVLENPNRLFAYVDLSNIYSSERDCYRNIINCIIEPNLNIFGLIENEIDLMREKKLPPHNEYFRSILSILNHFKGDLVIILDEIDALKSVKYSDNIFAQIRSNYFSRTSYPVLERLTYVLSGVIEPTELIKDKNKSPFNIGDKIYLDDFSKVEFDDFIKRSELNISIDISDEIFYWTNGNPRLTFDICSEVESHIIDFGNIEISDIKKIVSDKYLSSYDIAPIDHIRELVKKNRDVRKAIISIHNKRNYNITDEVKKKLYLFGIINSNFIDDIIIKNKIIELSLSIDWLRSIDKDNLVNGLSLYAENQFAEALEIFEHLVFNSESKDEVETSNYFAGMCYMKILDYEKAIKYFSFEFVNNDLKFDSIAFLGVCQIAIGNIALGISYLETAISYESNTHAYQNALLNLSIHERDIDRSLNLLEKLYESTFKSTNQSETELLRLRALSLYYQSENYAKRNNFETAISIIEKSLEICLFEDSIFLAYYKNILQGKQDLLTQSSLVSLIIDNNLKFREEPSPITFSEDHIYTYLSWVFDSKNLDLFERLLTYASQALLPQKNKFEIVYYSSRTNTDKRIDILLYILKYEKEIEDAIVLKAYRDILINISKTSTTYLYLFNNYLDLFLKIKETLISDIYIFTFAIKINSDKNKIKEAISLCDTITTKIKNLEDPDIIFESLIIYYWYSNLYFSLRNKAKAINFAEYTIGLIKNSNGKNMSWIDDAGLQSIQDQMKQIISSSVVKTPILSEKKFGRNDKVKVKYKNGTILTQKYKLIEADLLAGRCEIIE